MDALYAFRNKHIFTIELLLLQALTFAIFVALIDAHVIIAMMVVVLLGFFGSMAITSRENKRQDKEKDLLVRAMRY
jgi:Na+/H+ antiporter NhaB